MSAHDEELLAAVEAFDLDGVKAALEAGADVDARDLGSRTGLMTASMRSFIQIMEVLLGAGASVDLQDTLGETALILAASGRGGQSIQLLLDNGADPNLGDNHKKRPLMWVVDPQFHRGTDTSANVAPLVRAGARIDDRDEFDRTALMWAVGGVGTEFDVRPAVLTALVQNGADVGATDVNGETAMFHLVRYVDDALALHQGPACIRILLDAGANPNAENNENKRPLDVVDPRNDLVLDLLRDLGFTSATPDTPSTPQRPPRPKRGALPTPQSEIDAAPRYVPDGDGPAGPADQGTSPRVEREAER